MIMGGRVAQPRANYPQNGETGLSTLASVIWYKIITSVVLFNLVCILDHRIRDIRILVQIQGQ